MRKMVYILLIIPYLLQGQSDALRYYGNTLTFYGQAMLNTPVTPGGGGGPGPGPSYLVHPITHDQYYVTHPNIQDDDYLGYVHYLCTDSIFNYRIGDSYEWTLVDGSTNYASAFKVNSSTGLLQVNDADYADDGNYTLYIQITYGTDIDTAVCTVEYRTDCYYVDADHTGSDAGTYSNPWQDLTNVDDFGEFDDGMTVLLKRGTEYTPAWWNIDNQGDKIVLAAYGQGAKPILNAQLYDYGQAEQMIKLGAYNGTDGVDDCDYCVIMDIEFDGVNSATYRQYAIYHEEHSDHNEYWRLYCDQVNNGNGTFDFVGEWDMNIKIRDCGVNDNDRDNGHRGFKFESWGVDAENIWVTEVEDPAIMCGLWEQDFGTLKYVYIQNNNNNWEAGIQVRDQGVNIEWLATENCQYGVQLENYWYSVADPSPENFSLKNAMIKNAQDGISFWDYNDASEAGSFDGCTLQNVVVYYPDDDGFDISVKNCTDCNTITGLYLLNWLVVEAGGSALEISNASEINYIYVANGIAYESTGTDISTESASMNNATAYNIIYNTVTSWTYWGTHNYTYDYGTSGEPFVNSASTDFRTDEGESSIIDNGVLTPVTEDILGNEIGDPDLSPFEYGGNNFNWTDITPVPAETQFNIFYDNTFDNSLVVNGRNTQANVDNLWSSACSGSQTAMDVGWDSIKTVNGDTVWKVYLPEEDGNYGSYARGPFYLNGSNDTGDTLTYINYQFKIYTPSDYVYSAGSKLSGMAVYDRSGADGGGNNPVSGGIYPNSCDPQEPFYDEEKGSSMRFATAWDATPPGCCAVYTYHHDMPMSGCSSLSYGEMLRADTPWKFLQTGEWVKINIRCIINTVSSPGSGNADGVVELYRNDTLIRQATDIQFRNYSDQYFDAFFNEILTRADAGRTDPTFVYLDDYCIWRETNDVLYREPRTLGDVIESPEIGYDNP